MEFLATLFELGVQGYVAVEGADAASDAAQASAASAAQIQAASDSNKRFELLIYSGVAVAAIFAIAAVKRKAA